MRISTGTNNEKIHKKNTFIIFLNDCIVYKIIKSCRIVTETTIHQIWDDVNVNNNIQLCRLQQWEKPYRIVGYKRPWHKQYMKQFNSEKLTT